MGNNQSNGKPDLIQEITGPERGPAAAETDGVSPETEPAIGPEDPEASAAEEKARADEYYRKLLRLQADFDNFRRRTRQEREEWFRLAAEEVVTALLPVLDNFDRALEHPGERLDDFLSGVRMIHRQLGEILAEQGLERIPGAGREFDPNIHEAAARVQAGEVPENTVIEELRPGYYFKGKVIRPAMVKVAAAAKEENEEGA